MQVFFSGHKRAPETSALGFLLKEFPSVNTLLLNLVKLKTK